MSAVAIEAKSLSTLTALASNPPAYPRNPTHVRHEPLVLYIARVPGSKDVFLTPMKPREKVVTAEDIQSSLYFVHVEQPEDANLIASPDFREPQYSEQRPAPTNFASTPAVPRKAIPGAPRSQANNSSPVRKPVPGALAPVNNLENRQNVSAGTYNQRPGMLGPDYNPRRSFESNARREENDRPSFPARRSYDPSKLVGTSLTLIRRDPASGAQWNVARIEDPPVLEVSSSNLSNANNKRKAGAPMYVEITNPGYSKFLHSGHGPEPVRQNARDPHNPTTAACSGTETASQNTFRRRIWMEGSQYSESGFGHRKNSSIGAYSGHPSSRDTQDSRKEQMPYSMHPTPAPSFLTRDDQTYSTIQVSERQTSFRGYVFTSPWNGRCEFLTGGGGGSLKCRHVIPGLQGAPPSASTISELRFNLPGSSTPATPRGEEKSKRSSFFHRGRHSRNNSSISVDRDGAEDARNSLDRLDLSLGQEFAGGGFGGKQAKLGKIILEDEGLKMMDLLVAANLGLWWRAYERASGSRGDRGSISYA